MRQATSELLVNEDELIWVKRNRTAHRAKPDERYTVHCRVTRTAYQLKDGRLRSEKPASRLKGLSLARIEGAEMVPCCAGCQIRE